MRTPRNFLLTGVAGVLLGGLWIGWAASPWEDRLRGAKDPSQVWQEAIGEGEASALAEGLVELDGEALAANRRLLLRFLPGGDWASRVSPEMQARLVALLPAAGGDLRGSGHRLWSIARLTPRESLKAAALEALEALPEEAVPAGYVAAMAGDEDKAIPAEKMARGKEVYMRPAVCFTCHQPNGEGIPGAFPPLAGSEWMDGDTERLIKIVLKGLMGEITVKGSSFNNVMLPLELMLKDQEIADVLTYVRNSWGNEGAEVTPEQVAAVRAQVAERKTPYQVTEILAEHPLQTP